MVVNILVIMQRKPEKNGALSMVRKSGWLVRSLMMLHTKLAIKMIRVGQNYLQEELIAQQGKNYDENDIIGCFNAI